MRQSGSEAEVSQDTRLTVAGGSQSRSPVTAQPPAVEPEDKYAEVRVPFYLALNLFSSIGIVLLNKVIFQNYNFRFGTLLTLCHFIMTFVGLEVCRQFGVFERKKDVSLMQVLPLSLSFCGFVVMNNLSLLYNSVGFYQLMKVMTTPVIVLIQTFFYGETFAGKIKGSLAVICVGVATATVSDGEANAFGTFIAVLALGVTSQYQIWVGTKQKELGCSSYQLLYFQAPLSAMILVPVVFMTDDLTTLPDRLAETDTMIAVFASSCTAFLVNLSIFLVIGKTSPVTYNVLGHFKLTVILSAGFIFFGAKPDPKNITGILTTLCGVIWYTNLKQAAAAEAAAAKAAAVEVAAQAKREAEETK